MRNRNSKFIDIITYYVLVSSSINISVLLFIKDDIMPIIGHGTVDFILTVFLVNICVVIVLNYMKYSNFFWKEAKEDIKKKASRKIKYRKISICNRDQVK